ncbi:MAG: PSD1 and planctomycete cytochrome C domain-containing protein [Planctomycetaceae bacterium]
MFRIQLYILIAVLCPVWQSTVGADDEGPGGVGQVDFETDVRPLLRAKCFACHGEEAQESHLRLDRRASMLRGGDSGEPAIAPGNSDKSHLVQLVSESQPGRLMPPDESDRLNSGEIDVLRRWIDQGAPWPGTDGAVNEEPLTSDHWSFQPVGHIQPPSVDDLRDGSTWVANGIDAFVLRKLAEHSLAPNPQARRAELIRRVSLDMLGLPPSPEEVREFVSGDGNAYSALVEDVLADPRYGERWARYWLDLVRFAETNGFETNRERPNAWPYRDYVIRALNEDKPYDDFLREQIAGDALGVPVATSYLVAGPYDLVKSPDINLTLMQRQNELDDMINTTGTAFLGLTLGCARCHNHKFDPIRQTDYYSLQAVFAGVEHGDRTLPLTAKQQTELEEIDRTLVRLRDQLRPFAKDKGLIRESVNSERNEELFEPRSVRFVRFTIEATNSSEPCIDELEIFSGANNVALASTGATATCSSALPGYEIHKLEHVNDGLFGNAHSWISNEAGRGWIAIELPEPTVIDRIVWARDREGRFRDRVATRYVIEAAVEPGEWTTLSSSADRVPFTDGTPAKPEYDFEKFPEARALAEQVQELEDRKSDLNDSMTVYAGTFRQPGPTHRLFRGEPMEQREQVTPGTVAALGSLNLTEATLEQQRRLALAEWIASPQNPLTARVIANRVWQFHFGRGLVATPSDFGAAGVPPTHPELLDWLARELMDNNWSLKHLHRLILNSATYGQSSLPRAEALQVDAATQWWWRFPPRRLEAEPIRDSILSVTGVLDSRMFGPGFSGFEVELENVRHYFPKKSYGPDDWRRMIYMTKVRLERESVFGVFDCPDAATSVPDRSRSTTPLQALNLFNSQFMLQQSELLAQRLRRECGDDRDDQVTRAYWLCYGRSPEAAELSDAGAFADAHGMNAFCRAMLNSNEFVFLQ